MLLFTFASKAQNIQKHTNTIVSKHEHVVNIYRALSKAAIN